jgi:tetratricopeptide (TPR) repeat protein
VAWAVIVVALAAQYPFQERINAYRNTFRVILYPDAKDKDIKATVDQFKKMELEPVVTQIRNQDGKPATLISAEVPRKEWNGQFERYVTGVHELPMVATVVAGLNEQGIPLDQVQQLNLQDVGVVVIAALLGGFRKSAANVLWLQNEEDWKDGRAYRTVPLARAVTLLDPYFVDAWTITCWQLAYNMSVDAKTPDDAASYIKQGLDFAKGGITWNSTRYEIYQEIGWTYYDKLQNYAMAAEYLKKAINHPHPAFLERLIAHAYERIPDFDAAIFWYKVSLAKYGQDQTAEGAIRTITDRYLKAWKIYKTGDMDGAEVQLDRDWQAELDKLRAAGSPPPTETIYEHFKARIAEGRAEQAKASVDRVKELYRVAFETWLNCAKKNASDRLARRRVLTLAANFGWEKEVPAGYNDVGVPDSWAKGLQPEQKGREPHKAPATPGTAGAASSGAPPTKG